VIATIDKPFQENAGIVVVKGNLAEKGCVIKPSAATPSLLKHRGKAVVFVDIEDYHARFNDPALEVDEHSVLVLKNVGPKGYPGMPEVGNMGLPKKVLDKGVTDMVRISDGRMSGTAFGTVFLHVAPESAAGGTLAFVQNGDEIEVDVSRKFIHLHVDDAELEKRRHVWSAPDLGYHRGYIGHYITHVEQADQGADLDFLRGKSGNVVTRDSH
jgi:dihydroxy-acid dehydratase